MRLPIAFLLVLSLSACGGGGGDASPSDPGPGVLEAVGPDPLLDSQWHLSNTGQRGGAPGQDLGLGDVSATGAGVRIAIVDGAIQVRHPDLVGNLLPGLSHDYADGDEDPAPPDARPDVAVDFSAGGVDDAHGTAVAGIAVARAGNAIGGRGVAPGAGFFGLNMLVRSTLANTVDAMGRAWRSGAHIVNNSWGPLDPASGGTRTFVPSPLAWQAAVLEGVEQGRGGLGTVFVMAAGNGGAELDHGNRDGFASFRAVLAVGSVDDQGRPASFTEPGYHVLVAAPSGNRVLQGRRAVSTPGITTTDLVGERGYGSTDYVDVFNGTSASTPMVSAVVALMLEVNPRLSWRDVRWLLAATAVPANLESPAQDLAPSAMNAHGYEPRVGFGRVHAGRAVAAARTFPGLPPARSCRLLGDPTPRAIPDDSPRGLVLVASMPSDCILSVVEFVEVRIATDHTYVGDLRVMLSSPLGRESLIGVPHGCVDDLCPSLADGFTFGTVRHMGEAARGSWTLRVSDELPADSGTLTEWEVVLHGH